jgi:exosortase A-associated hydrolase 1
MRRILNFTCDGATLAATLDEATGTTGLLIVSGGNEIRIGAHRGMAMLAAEIASAGHPVFRFDRRGIGDSEGENAEFSASGPDIAAAIAAFRTECPQLTSVVAFGNCDAASALILHPPSGISGAVLANIWVIERVDEMPPPAAIRARYAERLRDPKAWVRLFSGAISLKKLAGGPAVPSSLAAHIAHGLATLPCPATILLAERDGTAIAFANEWQKPGFDRARSRADIAVKRLDSASHSFANADDHRILVKTLTEALA